MTRNGLTNLYGSKKLTVFIYTGLILSIIGAVIIYTPVIAEQQHYLTLESDDRMDYVLDGMSCNTILSSVELHESVEPIPRMIDGECWDHCQVLMEGYTPEPDHYFIHVPLADDGYMSFAGLDEKVQECK